MVSSTNGKTSRRSEADSIAHKTVVVTGASSGIGLRTAGELARRGARIVIVCRNMQRAAAAQEFVSAASDGGAKPRVVLADVFVLAEVRVAGEQIAHDFGVIDVLVNNAGSIFAKREFTVDGIEKTFAVNHLAPFLLTNLLLEPMMRAEAARVVTVTSETYSKRLDFENIQGEKSYNFFRAYQHSKLANILFTNELARLAAGTNLTANAVSPGPATTRFGDDLVGLPSLMPKVMKRIPGLFKSPERASEGVVRLAADPELDGVTGKFFLKLKEQELKPGARDPEAAHRLWQLCADLAAIPASPAVTASVS